MPTVRLTKEVLTQIDKAVDRYVVDLQDYTNLAEEVIKHFTNNESFKKIIHSSKFRTKDPVHLRNKLERIALEAVKEKKEFTITEKNLFHRINDLAGVRFLHIHTQQMKIIHPKIIDIINFHHPNFKPRYNLVLRPGPVAYVWDIETKKIFEDIGLRTILRPSMYASVHYVIRPVWGNWRCEIQVRTLMDEVWGEVSHAINYPEETDSIECKEQIRVLARIASGGTRLVDSIFISHHEYKKRLGIK